jgi:hypothetical protein
MNDQTSKLNAAAIKALLDDSESNKAFADAVISIVERGLLGKQTDSYNVDSLSFFGRVGGIKPIRCSSYGGRSPCQL